MSVYDVVRFILKPNTLVVLCLFLPAYILIALATLLTYAPILSIEKYTLLVPSYAQTPPATDMSNNTADDKTSTNNTNTITPTNQIHGTLIVTKNVIDLNNHKSNAKPSDFTITVHGNNPSPSSFQGSSSGTTVKLQMGMYSVTEQGPSGYKSTRSGDCSGGMMSVETKMCKITNTYTNKAVMSNETSK
jgi:hypothetical protein